jgi:hypothetical protein
LQVNRVCAALRAAMHAVDADKFFHSILTTHVRSTPSALGACVRARVRLFRA